MKIILLLSLFILSCNPTKINFDEKELDTFLNEWHAAAARADADAYFSAMTEDGIYIGTDKTERWYRDELREWGKKAFERESAWDFTPYDRKYYSSNDQSIVWFDELLETPNLGICRASGVLQNINGEWKIKHYHLSIAMDNDLVDDYLKLIADKKKALSEMEGHKE